MNIFSSQPARTEVKEETPKLELGKFELPVAEGEQKVYVTMVKNDAPFQSCRVGNIPFTKYLMPSEASLAVNKGKAYFPSIPRRYFAENQAKYLADRIAKSTKRIPKRFNQENKGDQEERYLPAETVKLSDWLILCPIEKFDIGTFSVKTEPIRDEKPITSTEVKQALYEAQGLSVKGKKS